MSKPMIALALLLLALVLLSGCAQGNGAHTIEIQADGFHPQELTIKAGETVTFVNKDAALHWPASGQHPTHTDYPAGGGCIGSAFDACGGLRQGESYSFTFGERGAWSFHDHLNSGLAGVVNVE